MNKFSSLIAFLILPLIGGATPEPISAENICKHIEILASDEFLGRAVATLGEEKTINYVADQFKAIGLDPAVGNSYFQEVALAKYNVIPPAQIKLDHGSSKSSLEHKKDFLIASTYHQESIKIEASEIVFAGFGIYAPEIGWDDYKGVDVKGKIVVVLSDVPSEYTKDSTLWKGDPAANIYAQSFYKKNEAASRGALGLLTIFKQRKQGFYNWGSISKYVGVDDISIQRNQDAAQLKFSGVISRAAADQLFEQAGILPGDFRSLALTPQFFPKSLKTKASFSFSNTWENIKTHNVAGLLPGKERPDEVMIYSAHWDHVGVLPGVSGDNIRNGAVDNASGTAALIEIARAFKNINNNRRSILFLATAAEEIGLLGSIWYNKYPIFPLGKTVANFNMDGHFPYGKSNKITGVVYGRSELDKYLEEAAKLQNRILVPNTEQNISQNIFFRSDHFPFAEVGIPTEFAVGFGEARGHDDKIYQEKMEAYQYKYHQPGDEYDADFNCEGIVQDADLIIVAGQLIDRDAAFPLWYNHQPFAKFQKANRFESTFFKDQSQSHTPLIATQGRTMDAHSADLDRDGDLDLVITGEFSYNMILINDGQGKFKDETIERLPLKRHDSEDIGIADFNLDGFLDLVIVSEDDLVNEYYLNDGKGNFSDQGHRFPVEGKSNAINILDINQDGYLDLIIGNDGRNFCLLNDQKGGWKESPERIPASTKTTQDIEVGDINNDGHLDIICGNEDDNEIWINDGTGFFRNETIARISLPSGAWESREADLGDIDGDGDLDLFFANVNFRKNKDPQNRLFINDGRGKFTDVTLTNLPLEKMHSIDGDFVDIDADGDLDLLTANSFGQSFNCYLNDGQGRFTNHSELIIPASVNGDFIDIEAADYDMDGSIDLYLGNFRGSDLLLFGKK